MHRLDRAHTFFRCDVPTMAWIVLSVSLAHRLAVAGERDPTIRITHGSVDLTTPPDAPSDQSWCYGMGMPVQLDAQTVGLLCNLRLNGTPYRNFEIGTDIVPFDRLDKIDAARAMPISRMTHEKHPDTGKPCVIAKYPLLGGFVPRGAKREDGAPHPYAGTGFGFCQICRFPANFKEPMFPEAELRFERELHQFSYDGRRFKASAAKRMDHWMVGDQWEIKAPGMAPAIADGDDLLFAITCKNPDAASVAGVARFKYRADGGWHADSFTPITDASTSWVEPSLQRDLDGKLLFSARSDDFSGVGDMALWRATDADGTWTQLFYVPRSRTFTPVILSQTVDGSAYFATNTSLGTERALLGIVPIDTARISVQATTLARDGQSDFGPPPSRSRWKIDHGIGNVVRLADGRWHAILVYRVMDQAESQGQPRTPQTGCYVEEVNTAGKMLVHPWRF